VPLQNLAVDRVDWNATCAVEAMATPTCGRGVAMHQRRGDIEFEKIFVIWLVKFADEVE